MLKYCLSHFGFVKVITSNYSMLLIIILVKGNHNNTECDEEEEYVEECAKKFLIWGNRRMPQSISEIDLFCR